MCKVCTRYHGTSEIEHGLCVCTVNNPQAIARGLSFRTEAQTMLYLSLKPPENVAFYKRGALFTAEIVSRDSHCQNTSNKRYKGEWVYFLEAVTYTYFASFQLLKEGICSLGANSFL